MVDYNELLTVGNITTIVNWIVNIILPFVASYGLDRNVLTSIILTVCWFAFTVFNSANPNTFEFLGNKFKECLHIPSEDEVLNDEYETVEVESDDDGEGC